MKVLIREVRHSRNMTIKQLSELTGIHKTNISKMERSTPSTPKLETIEKFAIALECEIGDLVKVSNPLEDSTHQQETIQEDRSTLASSCSCSSD